MEIIPLIKLKNRKVVAKNPISFNDALEKIDNDQIIYILDLDGIEKDKPNLCTYQKAYSSYNMWIDTGPRNIGDVVDAFMAGATAVTIRKKLYPNVNINSIREITENKIYTIIDFEDHETSVFEDSFFRAVDGLVNFNSRKRLELNFTYSEFLKKLKMKNKVYSYETISKNVFYWKKLGVKGLLVDVDILKEFIDDGF